MKETPHRTGEDSITIRPFYGHVVLHTDALGNLDWREWKPNHRLNISVDEQMRRNVANGYDVHTTPKHSVHISALPRSNPGTP